MRPVSRRKAIFTAVGVAAAGSVLAEAGPVAALADTTVQQDAVAPAVVGLDDAPTVAVDASLGNDFRLTIAGNRAMGNPASPTDGQQILFHITQGSAGPYTLTWGSGYEFASSLPQPTLSRKAGQIDLLGFVYNQAEGKWLCNSVVSGFSGTVTVPPPQGTYRLFPATDGPSTAVSYGGAFIAGAAFTVTAGGTRLDGFWWWVCHSGQPTSPQKFALWQVYTTATGHLIPDAAVTSGSLTAGQWNYVPLAAPVPLSPGATYMATTGFSGGFPDTSDSFGSGNPYSAGIVNGPLTAYSDQSGSRPAPFSINQGCFSVAGTDPTAVMPAYGYASDNFWLDMLIDTSPPAGTSYRLWPNYPTIPGNLNSDTTGYTLATEFKLARPCTLERLWYYSTPGAHALPTRCAIWNVGSQTVAGGTDSASPSWSGAAGSGWVSCSYSGVTLPAGDYKAAVFYGGGSQWYQTNVNYWASGPGADGITAGPVTAPGTSAATGPGQGTYNVGSWGYPQTYSADGNGENYWVDIEVTPA